MKGVTLIILVIVAIGICYFIETKKERYGQDASIRSAAGWIAGNGMYGYDPITQFQQQINDNKRIKVGGVGKNVGPELITGNPCSHSLDCKEGSVCNMGQCVPTSFAEDYVHPKYDDDVDITEGMCTKCG